MPVRSFLWFTVAAVMAASGACSQGAEAQPARSEKATPAPEKPAGKVTARAGAGHYDLGDYVVFGEVHNGTQAPIYEVELELTFQDASGKTIADGTAATTVLRIEPGQWAPVMKTHYGAPEGIASTTIKVVRWASKGPQRPVTILESKATKGGLGAIVTGKGRNDTGGPLSGIKLAAAFKDAQGKVNGVYMAYPVNGTLKPGATFDFTIETFDPEVGGTAHVVGEGAGP